jgi:hypothetical protein
MRLIFTYMLIGVLWSAVIVPHCRPSPVTAGHYAFTAVLWPMSIIVLFDSKSECH